MTTYRIGNHVCIYNNNNKSNCDGRVRLGVICNCRFTTAWVKEEENASDQRQKKREAEAADKVEVAPGVTVASLRRFRAALIGPTQGLTKRRRQSTVSLE